MSTLIATPSAWPARAAYFSAGIFTGASGAINVSYGWQKGSDLASSLTWAAVAAAVAVVFALSWPALIRSLEARRWSAALMALVALVLAGTYSVTAALGSAAGGRANAATHETATTDVRTKAQAAYDTAKAELATLKPARPVAELTAMRDGWFRAYRKCLSRNWPVPSGALSWRPKLNGRPASWRAPAPPSKRTATRRHCRATCRRSALTQMPTASTSCLCCWPS